MTFPTDWALASTDSQIVLVAPVAFQRPGVDGLGLTAQKYGSSIKIWALKNPAPWTLAKMDRESQGFLIPFGEVVSTDRTTVDGLPAIRRVLIESEYRWQTLFVATVKGAYSYFMEGGCPTEFFEGCQTAFQEILAGLELQG